MSDGSLLKVAILLHTSFYFSLFVLTSAFSSSFAIAHDSRARLGAFGDEGLFAGLSQPFEEALCAVSRGGIIPAVDDKGELHLLDVVGNKDAKWGTYHRCVREAQQLCGLCLCSGLVAGIASGTSKTSTPASLRIR